MRYLGVRKGNLPVWSPQVSGNGLLNGWTNLEVVDVLNVLDISRKSLGSGPWSDEVNHIFTMPSKLETFCAPV